MKRCKACGTKARRLYRAIVLSPSNKAAPGNVCATCKRLGWLFVFGEGDAPKPGQYASRAAYKADLDAAMKKWGIK